MPLDPARELGRPLSPQQVWPFKGHLGFRRSIESAGTVAAPLLAGFSLTLLVLILPTLPRGQGEPPAAAADAKAFSAFPELAAVLFLLAGLLLIGSVQATISMRYYSHTPSDLQEWYPQYFRESENAAPDVGDLRQWSIEHWPPERVDNKWFGGWARSYLFSELIIANWWARIARNLYHVGIFALLAGLTVAVFPPADARSWERWTLTAVAVAGLVAELAWIRWLDRGGGRPTAGPPPRRASAGPSPPGTGPPRSFAGTETRLSADGPLASRFRAVLQELPEDWSHVEFDLRVLDESRYIDAATHLVMANAQAYSNHDWHWRLVAAHTSGHGAAPEVVRATLQRLDDAGIVGELVMRHWHGRLARS